MNKTNISKEKIIEVCVKMLKESQSFDLNMRQVAAQCNVAVGSIYNYFPTKTELLTAIVEEVWRQVFHPQLFAIQTDRFPQFIDQLYKRAYQAQAEVHHFFQIHQSLIGIEGKNEAINTMNQYQMHMENALMVMLMKDKKIRSTLWSDTLTPAMFTHFVFKNMIQSLSNNEKECSLLIEILNHLLYQ